MGKSCLEKKVSRLRDDIEYLENNVKQDSVNKNLNFVKIQQSISDIEKRFAALNSRIDSLESSLFPTNVQIVSFNDFNGTSNEQNIFNEPDLWNENSIWED